jgi:hypothetical protein
VGTVPGAHERRRARARSRYGESRQVRNARSNPQPAAAPSLGKPLPSAACSRTRRAQSCPL